MSNLTELIAQIEQLSPESRAALARYVEFLRWQETQAQSPQVKEWSFSFIESFKAANVHSTDDPAGMDVKMALATVGGKNRSGLWAHPPVMGQAVVEYYVPVPQQVVEARLRLAIGIRDGAKITENNLVAFAVKVNGMRVWGQQSNEPIWQDVEIPLKLPAGDMARFEFTTEALGSHEWTWAVWGSPEVVGKFSGQ